MQRQPRELIQGGSLIPPKSSTINQKPKLWTGRTVTVRGIVSAYND